MDIIYWLIPLSIIILTIAIAIFFWAVRSGQFQDLDSPAVDILFDDDRQSPKSSEDKMNIKQDQNFQSVTDTNKDR